MDLVGLVIHDLHKMRAVVSPLYAALQAARVIATR